jgi:hypothetical protein
MSELMSEVERVPGLRETIQRTREGACLDMPLQPDAITAEQLASGIAAAWEPDPGPEPLDRERLFGLTLVSELEATADEGALAAVLALSAVGSSRLADAAEGAARHLRGLGLEDPDCKQQSSSTWRSECVALPRAKARTSHASSRSWRRGCG